MPVPPSAQAAASLQASDSPISHLTPGRCSDDSLTVTSYPCIGHLHSQTGLVALQLAASMPPTRTLFPKHPNTGTYGLSCAPRRPRYPAYLLHHSDRRLMGEGAANHSQNHPPRGPRTVSVERASCVLLAPLNPQQALAH